MALWDFAVWLTAGASGAPLPVKLAVGAAVLGVLQRMRPGSGVRAQPAGQRQSQVSPVSRS